MIRLLGDEMLQWSDPAPVRGEALFPLVAVAHGRTLIAGPHGPALIGQVPADDLTLLVRGLTDGEALAARFPAATVCVGGLAKFTAGPPFDTVIALAGLEPLTSAEGVELSWGESLDLLLGLLRPGGTLLLGVENFLGLHRLVALPSRPTDADWAPVAEHDPTRPRGLRRVRDRVGVATSAFAVYPSLSAPTLVLDADDLDREEHLGALSALITRAVEPSAPVLTDPRRLAVETLRHGTAADVAPAWIVTAGVRVDLARALPSGRTLQDLLLEAALGRDLPTVRELLGRWWDGPCAGVPADQIVVGSEWVALAPAGDHGAALLRFATDLIDGGYPHPWPAPPGPADLAVTLAAMTGRTIDPPAPADRPDLVLRDLVAARDRLTAELAEARAKHLWYEQMLVSREQALQRARYLLGASAPVRAVVSGARAAKRTLRVLRPR
ncbi:hypothetical protein [Actinoplanes friuliensis]|uniref:Class I SAM-dependent methyltransferase n=1 Tax=Actinoplanes friuliensis DSM 7358 TaxID=1246995 RepID=U5WEI5_9ACTN|nr:hypothetical protein [Actinoplanes friuliensis]AGZ46455.1 hypothetical protein AFR_41005 [Actinoplanes friuliensis DSM 7358]